jgi:hypothetical protein
VDLVLKHQECLTVVTLLERNMRRIKGIPGYMLTIPAALNICYVLPSTCWFVHKSEAHMNLLSFSTLTLPNGATHSSGSESFREYKQCYSEKYSLS